MKLFFLSPRYAQIYHMAFLTWLLAVYNAKCYFRSANLPISQKEGDTCRKMIVLDLQSTYNEKLFFHSPRYAHIYHISLLTLLLAVHKAQFYFQSANLLISQIERDTCRKMYVLDLQRTLHVKLFFHSPRYAHIYHMALLTLFLVVHKAQCYFQCANVPIWHIEGVTCRKMFVLDMQST